MFVCLKLSVQGERQWRHQRQDLSPGVKRPERGADRLLVSPMSRRSGALLPFPTCTGKIYRINSVGFVGCFVD